MNSSIQCLSHLKSFRKKIIELKFNENQKLLVETQKLFKDMQKDKDPIKSNVLGIKNVMSKIDERYADNNQEDANEFISIFLDEILEETKEGLKEKISKKFANKLEEEAFNKVWRKFYSKKGGSFLVPLFYGLLKTEKRCKCTYLLSVDFSTFNMLELSIYKYSNNYNYKNIRLETILSDFYGKKIKNKEQEYCPDCKFKNNNYNITTIYSLPKYLIIYFGRTIDNKYINLSIDYKETIDLTSYISSSSYNNTSPSSLNIIDSKEENSIDNINNYNLCGIIHYNSSYNSKSGHYTSTCLCDEDWYHFNDSFISEEKDITNFYGGEILLFYENSEITLNFKYKNEIYKINSNNNMTLEDIKKQYFSKIKNKIKFILNGKELNQKIKIIFYEFADDDIISIIPD